jgi:superfamily II RNA helicase
LSDFQKHSIKAIVDGNHSLVDAKTGSGKTVTADFAIQHFVDQGKRVIYTSPIKALSNQQYYNFSRKYPNISFGIFTGDIKYNPDADVIFATAEIVMNFLFSNSTNEKGIQFQIDVNNLGCIVMDEVHFILNEERGHVWEKTILMLPPHVQMVMLSATLDNPMKFAKWCERGDKEVIVSSTKKRIVPLTHYSYMTTTESIFKKVKDKTIQQQIRDSTNKLIKLKIEDGLFLDNGYNEIKNIRNILENNHVFLKRSHILNSLLKFLKENDLLPAIVFTFSRKNVENFANEITTNLLEDDSKIPYIVRNEAEQIVRKLPNYKEYLALPEYDNLIRLLEKGIGIHHSGMIPILREIVEIFISQRYIKVLFATSSFSIGLDCAIRSTVFTSLKQFDGKSEKYLLPHDYTQMSGRCGRRNIDTCGYVIHCNNLFETPSLMDYKEILCGKPQKLLSKFHISYETIINLVKNEQSMETFIEKSLINDEIKSSLLVLEEEMKLLMKTLAIREESIKYLKTPIIFMEEYIVLKTNLPNTQNKKRKETERRITTILDEYRFCISDTDSYKDYMNTKENVDGKKKELDEEKHFISNQIENICNILVKEGFLSETRTFTKKGRIASQFAEINPLILSEYMNELETLTTNQIIGILSCFTNIRVTEALETNSIKDTGIKEVLYKINGTYEKYEDYEYEYGLDTGPREKIIYDIIDEVQLWCEAVDEISCKDIIQNNLREKGISIGDFSKAILKISVISKELINICEMEGYVELQYKLSNVDELMLKYICTNQSLYV